MKIVRSLNELPPDLLGGAVSIGNFDGVHRGHARIVQRLLGLAKQVQGPALIFTFEPHPVRLLRPDAAPPPLTWTERKTELLASLGVDAVVVYPTDLELLSRTPEDFFQHLILDRLRAKAVVEGPNFFFGKNRAGDVDVLDRLCREHRVLLEVVPPLRQGSEYVSSSRIRQLIAAGEVAAAAELLTQPYRIRGMVTHGAARGSKLGFPTANVDAVDTLMPGLGVYAGRAHTISGSFAAAINAGPSPTFGQQTTRIEAHLLDFHGTLYGQTLEVDFLSKLRDIRPFGSIEELQRQLTADVAAAHAIAARHPAS